jgi:hypothetical protein
MKPRWVLMVACLLVAVWFVVRNHPHGSGHARQAGNIESASPNIYLGLRSLALQGSRANFGLGPGSKPTQPYAVVTDWGTADGPTTVIAIADGSASVYPSDGNALIGGGQSHESIRNAALSTIAAADAAQPLMHATTTFPLAPRGQVDFYLVSDAGVFTASASQEDVRRQRGPFAELADSAQSIITEYRKIPSRK